jgi:LAO/AO transport system kinase
VPALWDLVLEHRALLDANGAFLERRRQQALEWMRELVSLSLEGRFRGHPLVSSRLPEIERAVLDGRVTSFAAARELVQLFVT